MAHLPPRVVCSSCQEVVRTHQARRRVTLWARAGKGGTLSDVKDVRTEPVWLCDRCCATVGQPQESLL